MRSTASAIGLFSASDEKILERAKEEGRVVVTADLDYPRLLALHGSSGPGVILFRGGSYSDKEMLALLDRVLERFDASELAHSLTVVDRRRIRRHPFPLAE